MAALLDDGNGQGEALRLADAMVRLTHVVRRVFADVSREHGLTPAQAELLCALHAGPMRMTTLGRALDIEKSSLSGLVDRAEHRGLITRVSTPQDRRGYQVELTRGGARAARTCHDEVTRRLETLADHVPAADQARLLSTLARLLAAHRGGHPPAPVRRTHPAAARPRHSSRTPSPRQRTVTSPAAISTRAHGDLQRSGVAGPDLAS